MVRKIGHSFGVRFLSCLIHPPLRRHGPLQLVSEPVGSIWTFGLTASEPMLFRVVGMDTSRPPHFDSTNFPYYKARMACHHEAVDLVFGESLMMG